MNDAVSGFLHLISAAVTPVVMISACATLILGINNKHGELSTTLRGMSSDYRKEGTPDDRRVQIAEELAIFYRRFMLTWSSLAALYGAVCCFIATTLLIVITQRGGLTFATGTLTFFMVGIALMLIAAGLEMTEILLSSRTLRIELRDVVAALADNSGGTAPNNSGPKRGGPNN